MVWWRNQLEKGLIRRAGPASGRPVRTAGEPAVPAEGPDEDPDEDPEEGPDEDPDEEPAEQ